MELVDFKVCIMNGGIEVVICVIIDSEDEIGCCWLMVGVFVNIFDVFVDVLLDVINWKLY